MVTDQSSRQPAPPQCAPSGGPTRCCTWSRSEWLEWPCSTSWQACSWLCRPPLAPSKTRAAALGGRKGRFPADPRDQWSRHQLRRREQKRCVSEGHCERDNEGRDGGWEEPKKDGERMGWDQKENRPETVGQCIITTICAWDYPVAEHTVKSLSFDILECLYKCILERRKFWDSSLAMRLCGFTETGLYSV